MIDLHAAAMLSVMCGHEKEAVLKSVKDFWRSDDNLLCTLLSVNHDDSETHNTYFFVEASRRDEKIFLSTLIEKDLDEFLDLLNAGSDAQYY
jgi:hypothetical protein